MSSDRKIFNLHIGMPKTGTKTLQANLFPHHPELAYLGTYVYQNDITPNQCRDQEVFTFINELLWKNRKTPDLALCRKLYTQWKEKAETSEKKLLWSWESLVENNHKTQRLRAENMKAVVGDANIVACLRNPVALTKSLYLQLLKRDNIGAYAKKGLQHRFEPIEEWMAKGWDKPGHAPCAQLEYAESLQVFADVFGKDSIKILLFEQLVENQDGFIKEFSNFIGIDPDYSVQLASGRCENTGWTQEQFDRLKAVDQSLLRALSFRMSDRKLRKKMLGFHLPGGTKPKVQIDIAPEWIEKIKDKTREGNRMLQEQWGLPLEQYGYPV